MNYKPLFDKIIDEVQFCLKPVTYTGGDLKSVKKLFYVAGWDIETILDSDILGIVEIVIELNNLIYDIKHIENDGEIIGMIKS